MNNSTTSSFLEPSMVTWARVSSGYSLDALAKKIKKSPDILNKWESGELNPSYRDLTKLANVVKRPVAVFFFPEPPKEDNAKVKLRTLSSQMLQTMKPDTYYKYRKAQLFQIYLKELFSNQNPSSRPIHLGLSLNLDYSVEVQAKKIRKYLSHGLEHGLEKYFPNQKGDKILKSWRALIEDNGIFVFKDSFEDKNVSGFCVLDDVSPIIYINNGQAKTRQLFSLLHELGHILLNIDGASEVDYSYIDKLDVEYQKIEKFCNAIASHVLVPQDIFLRDIQNRPPKGENWNDEDYAQVAKSYGVSREVILRRLADMNKTSHSFYEKKSKEWNEQKKKDRGKGGDYYLTQNIYLSDQLKGKVIKEYHLGNLNEVEASQILNIRPDNFSKFETAFLNSIQI